MKVLIVDDSLTVRMDLAEAFEDAGFEVHPCATASQARETLARVPVDVIILDVHLPDADGVEFLKELRESPWGQAVAVLMLSSQAEVRDRVRALQTGADEYVGKPYDSGYVVNKARELVRTAQRPATQGPVVLVIDDSPTVRAELTVTLEQAGYSVLTANSGEEGLRTAADRRPAAVVVDGVMPGIDGATVIRRIRLDAALRATPCILLTGSEDRAAELRTLEAGADAFVRKEEPVEVLLARLAAALRGASSPRAPEASLLSPKRILAVDDSRTYLEEISAELSGQGFDVAMAQSGEEALELLAVQAVDCILLDLLMPGIGGRETCRRIKSAPVVRDIPLIMLTSLEDRQSMLDGLGAGADDYISKSCEFEVLHARVRAQLRRKQFEDEKRRIQAELLEKELEASQARAARELAEARATLISELTQALEELSQKDIELHRKLDEVENLNQQLDQAYQSLQLTQVQLVHSAKMVSLGQLVAGIAHEINNPTAFALSNVHSIKGWLERLAPALPEDLDPTLRALWDKVLPRLGSAEQGLNRIRDLVLKLRTFSRLDEGEFQSVDVTETIDSVLAFLGHRIGDQVHIERRHGPVTRLECFPGPLNQVLMNLLDNALDAVGQAGTIEIATEVQASHFLISVSDSGPGIDPEHLGRLFDPFFTTKPVGQGTGLGLSISASILAAHKGRLLASNRPQGGSQFLLEIPLDLAELLQGLARTHTKAT